MLKLSPDELLEDWLIRPPYTPSGNMSVSSDILAPLRHVMLKVAGAPTKPESLLGLVRLETGTLWHRKFEDMMRRRRIPVMLEVKLNDYLPAGWAGVADWIMWSDEYKAFVLGDLKTAKPESFVWLRRDGMKEAHLWQLSAYWHALADMGIPLVKAILCMYLPLDDSANDVNEPLMVEGKPLDRDLVWDTMTERSKAVQEYLEALEEIGSVPPTYVNEKLAPVQGRVQRFTWDSEKFQYDVKLAPHWSANYCPYPDELCDCSTQSTNKIGQYVWSIETNAPVYEARKGYEEIVPEPLSDGQFRKFKREVEDARRGNNA